MKKLLLVVTATALAAGTAYAATKCMFCNGTGFRGNFECSHCHGSGKIGK